MNKKILVGALATVLAGLAQAQSNVTLYGIVDLGVISTNSPNGRVSQVASGNQSGSRWGLRGVEDLGDGWKANFNLESGFNADTGASGQGGLLFGRRSTVGLSGAFGAIDLGRRDSPFFQVLDTTDPFGTGTVGINVILANGTTSTTVSPLASGATSTVSGVYGYTRRFNNMMRYSSPKFGGAFSFDVMYALGESNTTNGTEENLNNALSLNLVYAAGPAYVAYGYQNTKDASTTVAGVVTGTTPNKFQTVVASYDFTAVKAYFNYYTNKKAATTSPAANEIKRSAYAFSASVPFGASTVSAQYGRLNDKTPNTAVGTAAPNGDKDARFYGIGYFYNLSKRTNLYATYGNVNNSNFASSTGATLGGYSSNNFTFVNADGTSKVYSFGVRHQF